LTEPAKTKITAYHFNKGKEHAAQGSEVNQMEAKEHHLIFDDSEEELEANQHDLLFDDPEEEQEDTVKVNNFKTIQVSNAETTRKMYKDEGVDFDTILQAQQANTCLQAHKNELLDSDSSDEESIADLEVNMHNLRPKIQGLLEFEDSDDEDEFALNYPATMEEALAIDARGEIDDPDVSEEESVKQKSTAKMFAGMLHFSDSEDEDEAKFQLRTQGFTSSIEEAVAIKGKDVIEGKCNEGIIGEQEGDASGLTNSDTDQRRLIDEFYSHDGLIHFLDSEDEDEEKGKVGTNKEETKVMTRSEYEKANIHPPPASKAPYPENCKARSVSLKPKSPKTTKTTSPPQTPKITINQQVGTQIVKPKQGPKIKVQVATDTLLDTTDPGHQPGSMVVHCMAASPKQTGAKTFASVASTPKTPTLAMPQQAIPKVQTPTKPLQAKTDTKKGSPIKGEQQSKKGPIQFKGKGNPKPKPVTVSEKIVDVNKQIVIKAKQADTTDSPMMKKPFDKVPKPIKTTERIVQTPDGKGYQLIWEGEKKKLDTAQKFEQLGLLHFSDDEDDELSLETITSSKSKGLNKSKGSQKSNKSQGSQKLVTKPKIEQPNTLMQRTATKKVEDDEMTPFHQDTFDSAGGATTPDVKGSSAGGWTVQGSGSRQQNICQQLTSPKGIANLLRLCSPTPPQTDSDSGSAGSNKSNRFAVIQEEDEEVDSDATTTVLPIGEIPETIQEGSVLVQADSNELPHNIQVEVAKPEVEGGIIPQDNDPQPDGVVSSQEADFIKAELE